MRIGQIARFGVFLVSCLLLGSLMPALVAQTREEVVLWQSIKDSSRIADFQGYLDNYPNGTFASVARRRIQELKISNIANLTGTTWGVKQTCWVRYATCNSDPDKDENKARKHLQETEFTIAFGEAGACSSAEGVNRGTCRWSKVGQVITVIEEADTGKYREAYATTWHLTLEGNSMVGIREGFIDGTGHWQARLELNARN